MIEYALGIVFLTAIAGAIVYLGRELTSNKRSSKLSR